MTRCLHPFPFFSSFFFFFPGNYYDSARTGDETRQEDARPDGAVSSGRSDTLKTVAGILSPFFLLFLLSSLVLADREARETSES